jgi:hypothetical protein
MTLSVRNPEDAVNEALVRIGHSKRIQNIQEGSPEANAALEVYAQTRDELLRNGDWYFAQATIVGTVLKFGDPNGYFATAWDPITNPPPPWLFSYTYPTDCLKVRHMKPMQGGQFLVQMAPQPTLNAEYNDDTYSPARKVILSNVESAIITYTRQVTNPLLWESGFAEAFVAALARRLGLVLEAQKQGGAMQFAAQDEMMQRVTAEGERG